MDELTLLRRLVADEPTDHEVARAEVWRRLHGDATIRRSERGRRIAWATAATVVVGTASAHATVRALFEEPFEPRGRISRNVGDTKFSLLVPRQSGWENGPIDQIGAPNPALGGAPFRVRSLLISKSLVYGQGAEAVILWTAFPDGGEATPCTKLLSPSAGRSPAALATAMARAPGTKVVRRPTQVTVGGRPATQVVLRVRKDLGCDQGFFFTWRPSAPDGDCWGACWLETGAGDTIRVWIVDVDGELLVIEAATKDALIAAVWGTPVGRNQDSKEVAQEIAKIIESIRFD